MFNLSILSSSNIDHHFDIDDWNARLVSVCGSFQTQAEHHALRGSVSKHSILGLDMANVNIGQAQIIRTDKDIKKDDAAYYFLIGQIASQSHIQHAQGSVNLLPGDLVLVDSSQPSKFIYTESGEDAISEQISIHIPRDWLNDKRSKLRLGCRIEVQTNLAKCIWAQLIVLQEIAILLDKPELHTQHLRDLFLKSFVSVFHFDRFQDRFVQVVLWLLKDTQDLWNGVDYFADRTACSRRTFFRIFEQRQTSFIEMLRYIRLLRFLKLCSSAAGAALRPSVSSLIFQAGFTDVSNFNHYCKSSLGLTPSELVRAGL